MKNYLNWLVKEVPHQAVWLSESNAKPPERVRVVDETLSAEQAHQWASEGYALLWYGDFQSARQLLAALVRRLDKARLSKSKRASNRVKTLSSPPGHKHISESNQTQAFHLHRMAQAQRARILNSIIVVVEADHRVLLRRAPDVSRACFEVLGTVEEAYALSLRQLLAYGSASEWRRKGVFINALGEHIHPHYGVFSPVRGEYLDLLAQAPLPAVCRVAWDVGTGTGVIAAILARRGIDHVVATDMDTRALTCAQENIERLGLSRQVSVCKANLFPDTGRADLMVCNPPWLPAKAAAPIERAVYDENNQMLAGFLLGVCDRLNEHGQAWLIMSDLAEHLGLRAEHALMDLVEQAGLSVLHRYDTVPTHKKIWDDKDALHHARIKERTSLWCLLRTKDQSVTMTN